LNFVPFFSFSIEFSFRSGVTNFKGTDCGEQSFSVQGVGDVAGVETGRTAGPWGCDVM